MIGNKTIDEIQEQIIEDFSVCEDWMDKYALLIDMGNVLTPLDVKYKIQDNLIEGCQSRIWLHSKFIKGKVYFSADSDSSIVKRLISLLIFILNDSTPTEILSADLYFIKAIGLQDNLSPTRSNGLLAMVKRMKERASGLI